MILMRSVAKKFRHSLKKHPWLVNILVDLRAKMMSSKNKTKNRGKNNTVRVRGAILQGVIFDIEGDNNSIIIDRGSVLAGVVFRVRGSGHKISIGKGCCVRAGGNFWFEDNNCTLAIGNNTTIEAAHIALTEPHSCITIGEDCMLAYDIDIRCGDSHSIIDLRSGKRINRAEHVLIGDHVWISAHVIILKGVEVGANSVIGTGSVVSASIGENNIAVGNPARVVKSGITWDRQRFYED